MAVFGRIERGLVLREVCGRVLVFRHELMADFDQSEYTLNGEFVALDTLGLLLLPIAQLAVGHSRIRSCRLSVLWSLFQKMNFMSRLMSATRLFHSEQQNLLMKTIFWNQNWKDLPMTDEQRRRRKLTGIKLEVSFWKIQTPLLGDPCFLSSRRVSFNG